MSEGNDVKLRRNTKACKQCNKQLPPASKTCPCGYSFKKVSPTNSPETTEGSTEQKLAPVESADTSTSVNESNNESSTSDVQQRRTQRTRRERPQFFDSLEYGSHFRQRNTTARWLEHSTGTGKRKGSLKPAAVKSNNASTGNKNSASANIKYASSSIAASSSVVPHSVSRSNSSSGREIVVVSSLASASSYASCSNSNCGTSNGCNDDDIYNELTTERQLHYAIILAELNRKCGAVRCQPG